MIEMDPNNFTRKLPKEKREKAVHATTKILKNQSVEFIKTSPSVGFFLFYFQAVKFGRVFMRRLWGFVNDFPQKMQKKALKRIPIWVREDLQW